ncbi:Cytochrome P450 306a1, partial [Gryllus bimaculatus]
MALTLVLVAVTVLLALLAAKRLYHQAYERPPNFPPGPPRLPIWGSYWLLLLENYHFMHKATLSMARRYNTSLLGLFLGQFPTVVATSYEHVRTILTRPEFAGRPDIIQVRARAFGERLGVFFSDGQPWLEQKRFMLRNMRDFGFGRRFPRMEETLHEEVGDLVALARGEWTDEVAMKDGCMKFPTALYPSFINVLWMMIAGQRFSRDQCDELRAIAEASNKFVQNLDQLGGAVAQTPWLAKIAPEATGLPQTVRTSKYITDYVKNALEDHERTYSENHLRDFIDRYIQEMRKLGPRKEFSFTEAIIRETLRFNTLVPSALPHQALEDTTLGGYDIPKHTIVICNLHAMHHDKELWGDPENFRPERFLDEHGKLKRDISLPFGAGKRLCAGETFARQGMFVVLAALLQNFNLEAKDRSSLPPIDHAINGLTLTSNNMWTALVKQSRCIKKMLCFRLSTGIRRSTDEVLSCSRRAIMALVVVLLVTVTVLLALLAAKRLYHQAYERPPNFPPGPPRLPIWGSYWLLLLENYHFMHKATLSMARRYNTSLLGLFLGQFPTVVATSYEHVRTILTSQEFAARPDIIQVRARAFGERLAGQRFSRDQYDVLRAIAEASNKFVQSVDQLGGAVAQTPWLANIAPEATGLPETVRNSKHLSDTVKNALEDHERTYSEDHLRDFIDRYIKEMRKLGTTKELSFSEKQLQLVAGDLLVAAPTTTSSTLTFAVRALLYHPEVQRRSQEELDRVVGRDRLPTLDDRFNLPYTEAIIRETLRYNTLLPLALPHLAAEDATLGGYDIPKNTIVICNLHAVHHDKELWGDPQNFRPERFLDDHGKLKRDITLPFGTGKRLCPGETFSRQGMFVVLAALLQNFNLEPKDRSTLPPIDHAINGLSLTPNCMWVLGALNEHFPEMKIIKLRKV